MFGFFTVNPTKKQTEQPAKIVGRTSALHLFLFLLLTSNTIKMYAELLTRFQRNTLWLVLL